MSPSINLIRMRDYQLINFHGILIQNDFTVEWAHSGGIACPIFPRICRSGVVNQSSASRWTGLVNPANRSAKAYSVGFDNAACCRHGNENDMMQWFSFRLVNDAIHSMIYSLTLLLLIALCSWFPLTNHLNSSNNYRPIKTA